MQTTREGLRGRILAVLETGDLPSARYVLSLSVVGGIALGTFALHLWHLLVTDLGPVTIALGILLPMALSAALFGVVGWIHWQRDEYLATSIGLWCLAGAIALIAVSVHSMVYQYANGVTMEDRVFVIANHATVGALLGAVLGLYEGQRRSRTVELREERGRAKRLSTRLSVLNRVLRHDIRNAVNVIQGNTRLARSGSREVDTIVETIDSKAEELQQLSERAREMTRLLERESIETESQELGLALQAKVHKLRNDHPEVEFEMDVEEGLTVRAVPQLDGALDELLQNAIRHNDAEQTELHVSASAESGTDRVLISIIDNGPGIPDSEIAALRRGRETDLVHASGVGLWFVRWVADRSDGELSIEERDPRGTVVELTLPAATPSGA